MKEIRYTTENISFNELQTKLQIILTGGQGVEGEENHTRNIFFEQLNYKIPKCTW